jgi:hypothetical protein
MSIRGRVDVYRASSEQSFIAVASSTELDGFGRPVEVRIVEFMAGEPLYKATRIRHFEDFDFRVSEVHDGVMTLLQVQQLWNQVPSNKRWWPVEPHGSIPFRAADLIYATLGPMATAELLHVLGTAPARGSDSVGRLTAGLAGAVGRRPWMLIALTTAIGTAQRYENRERSAQNTIDEWTAVDRFAGETLKHLGSLVLEAAEQFGLTYETFGEWFESQDSHLFEPGPWPPTQVPYTLDEPEFNDVIHQPTSDLSDAEETVLLAERQLIQTLLERDAGITRDIHGPQGPDVIPSTFNARSWVRLVSATVQSVHTALSEPEVDRTVLGINEMFIYGLCESISSLPTDSWNKLTNSRRICFVADLGELLMIVGEIGGGDVIGRAAVALAKACGNDPDLITIAEQAGHNLPYQNGREDFRWGIDFVKGYEP